MLKETKKLKIMKTSIKLEKIINQARLYIYGGKGYNSNKFNTSKWSTIRNSFEKEANKIGADYTIGDCLS